MQTQLVQLQDALTSLSRHSDSLLVANDNSTAMLIKTKETEMSRRITRLRQLVHNSSSPSAINHSQSDASLHVACEEVDRVVSRANATLADRTPCNNVSTLSARAALLDNTVEQLVYIGSSLDTANRLVASSLPGLVDRVGQLNTRWRDVLARAKDQCRVVRQQLLTCRDVADKCDDWLEFVMRVERSLSEPLAGSQTALTEQKEAISVRAQFHCP